MYEEIAKHIRLKGSGYDSKLELIKVDNKKGSDLILTDRIAFVRVTLSPSAGDAKYVAEYLIIRWAIERYLIK